MSELYQQYLGAGPIGYMADLFAQMTEDESNGMQLALEFYAPIFLLYSMYDAADLTEKKKMTELLRRHIERFSSKLKSEYGIE